MIFAPTRAKSLGVFSRRPVAGAVSTAATVRQVKKIAIKTQWSVRIDAFSVR
jgi:hypothetical protein